MSLHFKLILLLLIVLEIIRAENINILHLTDVHYDIFYQSNSSIYSFCHRNSTKNDEISTSLWGRECDSSESLIHTTLNKISGQVHNISVILLTGDNIR